MPYNLNVERDSSVDEILSSIKEIIEENTARHYAKPSSVANASANLSFSPLSVEEAGVSVDEAMSVLAQQIGVPLPKDSLTEDSRATLSPCSPAIENKELIQSLFDQAIEDTKAQLKVIISKWVQENLPKLIKELLYEEITRSLKNMK